MRELIRDYFTLNKQQRNGLVVLCVLLTGLVLARLTASWWMPEPAILIDFPPEKFLPIKESEKTILPRQPFDPNTVTLQTLLAYGFPERLSKSLVNFHQAGFQYRSRVDLKRIRGMTDSMFQILAPLVVLPDSLVNHENTFEHTAHQRKQVQKVELNSSDSIAIEKLPGIGWAFARRIIKYRSMLGGYAKVEQLKEVYGLKPDLFEKIQPYCWVDASLLQKINLNLDEFKIINKHPYISFEACKTLCNLRRSTPLTLEMVKEVIHNDSLYQKLLPYIVL